MTTFNDIKSRLVKNDSLSIDKDGFEQYYIPKSELWFCKGLILETVQITTENILLIDTCGDVVLSVNSPTSNFKNQIQVYTKPEIL